MSAPARTSDMSAEFVTVEGLSIDYGGIAAVDDVSFTVRKGEQLTLLGPSGCGKTTTLRAIAGLEQPTAGEIRIGGAPVYSSANRVNIPAEKRGLSMVFQSYAIWPHMTVFENVAYGLRVRRESKEQIAEKVDPHILGGLVVQQEDVIRDYSVRARLESLRERMN